MSGDHTIIDAEGQEHPIEWTHTTWGHAVMEDGSEPDPERMERWRRAVEWSMREFKNGAAYVPGLKVTRLEQFPRNPLCFCSGCGRVFANCQCDD